MKISIITVCYNSAKTIEKTIESVASQTYQDIEYIIVDGKSTDESFSIFSKYNDVISKVLSEPDEGIYDAMNKGLELATGDYLMFLNSDDQLYDEDVIEKVAQACMQGSDIVYGNLCHLDNQSGKKQIRRHNKLNKIYLIKNTPCQPATLYKKEVFDRVGFFNTDFKIVSDQEWFLRAFFKFGITSRYIDYTLNIFNQGGVSTNVEHENLQIQERKKMFSMYFSEKEFKIYSFIAKNLRSLTTIPIMSFLMDKAFKTNL